MLHYETQSFKALHYLGSLNSSLNDSSYATCNLLYEYLHMLLHKICVQYAFNSITLVPSEASENLRIILLTLAYRDLRRVFQGLPEPTRPTVLRPLLSLYGIIYVTWYTSSLPEAT